MMHRPSLTRLGYHHAFAAAAALLSSAACQDEDAPETSAPAAPSSSEVSSPDGTGSLGAGGSVGSEPVDPDVSASGEGIPTPALTGNDGQGGASASEGTGAPDDMPAMGGASGEPAVPAQDDPSVRPPDTSFDRVEIPAEVTNVMSIDIDAQDRVYVLERTGGLKIWYPSEGRVLDAGAIPVFSGNEDGALNIRLDPNFSTNGWAYIYYSSTLANENVLSRFDIVGDALDRGSEKVLLRVPDHARSA